MRHKPYARGVSHLMYVGDDEAVENASAASGMTKAEIAIGGLAAAEAIYGTSKASRRIGAVIAIVVGVRAIRFGLS